MDSNHFWVLSDATIDTAGRLLVTGTYQTQTQPMIARLTATGALGRVIRGRRRRSRPKAAVRLRTARPASRC